MSKTKMKIDSEEVRLLKEEVKKLTILNRELTETNNHLITATWRERELKEQLQKSSETIIQQNKKISDSINYARRIQSCLVASESDLKSNFDQSFVFYKPKDIVSGDFPWVYEVGDVVYTAAVDCTGHGVPGAMLASVSCLLLNEIAKGLKLLSTEEILDKLHNKIQTCLKQENDLEAAREGLDISLAMFNKKTSELQYSGAHRPLIYFSNNKINLIKGDRVSVGGSQRRLQASFSSTKIKLEKGDTVFLFTDGISDQFKEDPKPMKYKTRFMQYFPQYQDDIYGFKNFLISDLKNWMGEIPQTDDMLMLCFKV
ncbi:MAG: SpoIIE family protein phosphatase [Flavobacteriales bacterium]|nr:SpoIIE family protein phosphatase [Flavobacteriales bacterium]